MRILHMALPSLALALLLGFGLACLQDNAARASSCDPKNDRVVILLPGFGKIVTTRGELQEAKEKYVTARIRELCAQDYLSVEEIDELDRLQGRVAWGHIVAVEGIDGDIHYWRDSIGNSDPPFNHAAYVIWCMLAFQEGVAAGDINSLTP